jgi:hypothetical protein
MKTKSPDENVKQQVRVIINLVVLSAIAVYLFCYAYNREYKTIAEPDTRLAFARLELQRLKLQLLKQQNAVTKPRAAQLRNQNNDLKARVVMLKSMQNLVVLTYLSRIRNL